MDRRNVVVSLALMERHINYTLKSTVNIIEARTVTTYEYRKGSWNTVPYSTSETETPSEKTLPATVYYRSSTIEQEKGN